MRTYVVIAGSYARTRSLLGRPLLKDEKVGKDIKASDCIIAIEGLDNDEMFPPMEMKRRNIWHCKTCQQTIPEYMMEKKIDCYFHDKEVKEKQDIPIWPNGYGAYEMKRRRFLKPMYRIWLSHVEGREKLIQLWRYINMYYPANKPIALPIPVARNMREMAIDDMDDVPLITLLKPKEETEEEEKNAEPRIHTCEICNASFAKKNALRMHKYSKHER